MKHTAEPQQFGRGEAQKHKPLICEGCTPFGLPTPPGPHRISHSKHTLTHDVQPCRHRAHRMAASTECSDEVSTNKGGRLAFQFGLPASP
eukprot:scaffold108488_cov17-Tisochrysis_lutea.AAC.1